jgi:hypothetical protein
MAFQKLGGEDRTYGQLRWYYRQLLRSRLVRINLHTSASAGGWCYQWQCIQLVGMVCSCLQVRAVGAVDGYIGN